VRGIVANVFEGGGIAVVGVDPSKFAAILCNDTLNIDISLALRGALFIQNSQ
jgi:hypothetical protein